MIFGHAGRELVLLSIRVIFKNAVTIHSLWHNLFRNFVRNLPILFMNPPSGWLISLEDAAAFALVYLSLCFQPCIKMPGSAGYHGASSLLSAHFNPVDFSSRIFISAFLSTVFLRPPSLSFPPILIPFLREDKTLLNNVTQGHRILFQFVAAITKRRPSWPSIQHLRMIVSLNYKAYQHPWMGEHRGDVVGGYRIDEWKRCVMRW